MEAPQEFIIAEGARPARADRVLAAAFPEHSRTALQRAFDAGLVRRGDVVLSRDTAVAGGDRLRFSLPAVAAAGLKPADIPLDVLFEDRHLLAVNKASGMIVHPGAATGDDTLVHALLAHCAGSLSGIGGVERPGIVHRLDKETTGVIVVAKNYQAHRALADQFATRTLTKEYVALVAGVPQLLSGTIDRAIGRHPVHRHRMTIGEGGKPARTDWERVEAFGDTAALLRCRIFTGRTHQIRVQHHPGRLFLQARVGFPAVERVAEDRVTERFQVHAEHLVLAHPVTGKELDLRAPLPPDFTRLIRALRKAAR
ncbi:MAG: RluA family pseudouridine synthase [Opitutaceae bacterium]